MENFDALSPTMKYDIAKVQGDILQLAADKGYDMEEFIENYMTSDFVIMKWILIAHFFILNKPKYVCHIFWMRKNAICVKMS